MGEPIVSETPTVLSGRDLHLPVEGYMLTSEEITRIDRARLLLIDRCMRKFDFSYQIEEVGASGYGPEGLVDRRYGITNLELAKSAGYGLGARDPNRRKPVAEPSLSPEGITVLGGEGRSVIRGRQVPEGGCVGEASRELDASSPAGAKPDLGEELQLRSFELSKQDSRVKAAMQRWSECMSGKGYNYSDPLAPLGDPQLGVSGSAEAVKVAAFDIECKRVTNIVGIWFSVESAYQNKMIEERVKELELTKQAIRAKASSASKVLAAASLR
ncbi:hypothetical protein [Micromonospora sediminicola]|uniref:hypothetical protein n=1 Tax=Micromonospora sediminicola TaxID=946078 RepID=UPI0037BAD036